MMGLSRLAIAAAFALLVNPVLVFPQTAADPLLSNFEVPPNQARPLVWWHWMNGNITESGIKLDLEWMHRAGLGGFQTFDAALATTQVVEHRLAYMTPEWKHAFSYATKLADQYGMEEGIADSPGWSETGGPWVPASEGMKKFVWSETRVEGGRPFTGVLAHPPSNTGNFQNIGIVDSGSNQEFKPPQFYADSAVVAYRVPPDDVPLDELHPVITTNSGPINPSLLTDGNLNQSVALPHAKVGESAWIGYEFSKPQSIQAITIVMGRKGYYEDVSERRNPDSGITFEASDDGATFRPIVTMPKIGTLEHTLSFAPVAAKFFRVAFKTYPPPPPSAFHVADEAGMPKAPTEVHIAELVLHAGARVNRFEEKAGFSWLHNQVPDLYPLATTEVPPRDAIDKGEVLDLTARMHPDGTLSWTPPPGTWVVLRFGYSLLGITNHPATKEATGLEVDKLNAAYVKHYMDNYLDRYKNTVGAEWMGARGIAYVVNDSWEAGAQNWTDNMIAEFTRRRGYDPHPWMPVLAGRVVESAQASDRFLWDFRKTIADLTAEDHYGQISASLKERGMGQYAESHEGGRAFVGDGMEVKKFAQIPMGAMWTQTPGVNKELFAYEADDHESASVAHIYGQNLAAAESMTASAAPWAWSPSTLKPTADQEFLNGINRIVVHESAHQPLVGPKTAPGLTLGPYGQWFSRNETWAEQARPWVDYLARSSYLLQQGRFAADLIYFYGEDSNLTQLFGDRAPETPAGFNFDYINADGLIHELTVTGGFITTKSGMTYRVLGLDGYSRHMSLPVLRAIYRLVAAGAVVAGPKPEDDPSLADDRTEFAKLANDLFGDGAGLYHVGMGSVYAGESIENVFKMLKVPADFEYTKPESDTRILFVHRKLADGDLYFIDNRYNRTEQVDATFRVDGKAPELWHADTGKTEPISYKIADGRTTLPLRLEPWGTVFVVFRKPSATLSLRLAKPVEVPLATPGGAWTLSFQPDRGAPASIAIDKLASWSDSADAGIKYFSGTGTYEKTLNVPRDWIKPGTQLFLDLGDVKDLAEVVVNGISLGIVWHAPYRADVTRALQAGDNRLEIKVTNAWVNRLIGDEQPNAVKYTYADVHPYRADSPLLPSGLLGPVRIVSSTVVH
jgi:hypothetical protein